MHIKRLAATLSHKEVSPLPPTTPEGGCKDSLHIIERPEYMGHTVNFRTYKDSYKDKQAKENPKENWAIFENTHPAIVDPTTWETAQRLRKTARRTDHGEANPLTGVVFCADCGAKLYNHRQPYPTTQINKKGYGKGALIYHMNVVCAVLQTAFCSYWHKIGKAQ